MWPAQNRPLAFVLKTHNVPRLLCDLPSFYVELLQTMTEPSETLARLYSHGTCTTEEELVKCATDTAQPANFIGSLRRRRPFGRLHVVVGFTGNENGIFFPHFHVQLHGGGGGGGGRLSANHMNHSVYERARLTAAPYRSRYGFLRAYYTRIPVSDVSCPCPSSRASAHVSGGSVCRSHFTHVAVTNRFFCLDPFKRSSSTVPPMQVYGSLTLVHRYTD